MISVEEQLEKKLRQLRVHIDAPDDDTVLLRNVPVDDRYFNKPRTNLLIKRPRKGMPYLICVDEDLEYSGDDSEVTRVFVAGHKQQGWRVLVIGHDAGSNIQTVIMQALSAVGFDGENPRLRHALPAASSGEPGKLLASFAIELAPSADDEPTIGREEQIEEILSSLLQWQVRLPLIAGESGVGKTNLIRAAARKLNAIRPDFEVTCVDLNAVMSGTLLDSERESLLITLLREIDALPKTVFVIEHLELALMGTPRGHQLLSDALDRGAKLIGTTLPAFAERFQAAPLARRVQLIALTEMTLNDTLEVLRAVRTPIAEHHRIRIEETLLEGVIDASLALTGQLPAKAIALLDSAAAMAAMTGECELSLFYVHAAAAKFAYALADDLFRNASIL